MKRLYTYLLGMFILFEMEVSLDLEKIIWKTLWIVELDIDFHRVLTVRTIAGPDSGQLTVTPALRSYVFN